MDTQQSEARKRISRDWMAILECLEEEREATVESGKRVSLDFVRRMKIVCDQLRLDIKAEHQEEIPVDPLERDNPLEKIRLRTAS